MADTERNYTGTTNARDSRNFSRGYQAALRDIRDKLAEGGEEAVRVWVQNNLSS